MIHWAGRTPAYEGTHHHLPLSKYPLVRGFFGYVVALHYTLHRMSRFRRNVVSVPGIRVEKLLEVDLICQGAFELGVLEGICKNTSLKHLRCAKPRGIVES